MATDQQNASEARFLDDLKTYRSTLTHISKIYAQDPNAGQAAYTELRPVLEQSGRGAAPEKLTPAFLEAGLVFTAKLGPRLREFREANNTPGDIIEPGIENLKFEQAAEEDKKDENYPNHMGTIR